MTRHSSFKPEDIQQAKQKRDHACNINDYRSALSVLLVGEYGLNADQTAEVLGISRRTVFRNKAKICNQNDMSKKTWGGRRNSILTIDEEKEFLSQWLDQATTGGVLTVPPIHAALITRLGYSISISTTYRLLARHGWRKVQPDTKHPKSDPIKQEEFKKNSLKLWLPSVKKI